MADADLTARMVAWGAERDIPHSTLSLAMQLLSSSGDVNDLKGPVFNEFIAEETKRAEQKARFNYFHSDDWDFHRRTVSAILDDRNRNILIVVPSYAFGDSIQELLDEADLPLKSNRKYHWDFQFPDRRCVVRMASVHSDSACGMFVDEVVFHNAITWRAYEKFRPCQRPRSH